MSRPRKQSTGSPCNIGSRLVVGHVKTLVALQIGVAIEQLIHATGGGEADEHAGPEVEAHEVYETYLERPQAKVEEDVDQLEAKHRPAGLIGLSGTMPHAIHAASSAHVPR